MIRFGSRGSDLALTQTRHVAEDLKRRTGEDYTIDVIHTRGDKILSQPLPKIGGKGLFTAELEHALREERIDIAVHSLKDLPVESPEGLINGAVPTREDPRDVLVFRPDARDLQGGAFPLRPGCRIGTSSPRRSSSILARRADLDIADIRGNVETRARKVAEGDYDATVLAAAGLSRLGLVTPELERLLLPAKVCTPAPGQGALGLQCRTGDERIRQLLAAIHDEVAAACVNAERRVLWLLGGGCSMPLGVLVQPDDSAGYRLTASLFSEERPDCGIRIDLRGSNADDLAEQAAAQLQPLRAHPLAGKKLVLLRPGGSGAQLGQVLGMAGAEVRTVVVSEIQPLPDRTGELSPVWLDVVAFTSARAVDFFFERCAVGNSELRDTRFFGVGPATQEAVQCHGYSCEAPTGESGGAALARLITASMSADRLILYPCAENRHGDFESTLQSAGYRVEALPIYRTVMLDAVEIPAADYLIFTSPSAVRAYTAGDRLAQAGDFLAIGQTTASAMAAAGIHPRAVSQEPTAQALISLIRGVSDDDAPQTTAPDRGDS